MDLVMVAIEKTVIVFAVCVCVKCCHVAFSLCYDNPIN